MKNSFLFSLVAAIFISFSTAVKAEDIPLEVSAVMLAPGYSKILNEQLAKSTPGKSLRVASFDVLKLGEATIVYFHLATKFSADFAGAWTNAGSIVAHIEYGPMGEVIIDGLYFKPAEDIPGGGSVSNN